MSQSPSSLPRKSSRTVRKSTRARESDEFIPGIASSTTKMASASPMGDVQTPTHLPSPDPLAEPAKDKPVLKSTTKAAKEKQKGRAIIKQNARKSAKSTPVQKARLEDTTTTPQRSGGMATTWAQSFAQASMPMKSTNQPRPQGDLLSRLQLRIYAWPEPAPKDLQSTTDWHKTWKDRQDEKEAFADNDQDLDDWFIKSGNAAAYSSNTPTFSLQYSIARSFIMRAKRAFRLDSTWEDFEDSELAIDSMSQAREVQNPLLRGLHMREAVDNDLRLKIFQDIRQRLCTEIWLQPFSEHRRPLMIDRSGTVVAPIPGQRVGPASERIGSSNEVAAASLARTEKDVGDQRTTRAGRDAEDLSEESVSLVFQLSFDQS